MHERVYECCKNVIYLRQKTYEGLKKCAIFAGTKNEHCSPGSYAVLLGPRLMRLNLIPLLDSPHISHLNFCRSLFSTTTVLWTLFDIPELLYHADEPFSVTLEPYHIKRCRKHSKSLFRSKQVMLESHSVGFSSIYIHYSWVLCVRTLKGLFHQFEMD